MDRKQIKAAIRVAEDTQDPSTIAELSIHEATDVRWAIVNNPMTDSSVLKTLSEDADPQISHSALRRLEYLATRGAPKPFNKLTLFFSTLHDNPGIEIESVKGLVFGSASNIAWGLNSQADRLDIAAEEALFSLEQRAKRLGANAIIGVSVAVNSSTGAQVVGNSDGALAYGTAVFARFPEQ